jgi:streptogramin lyase
MFTELRVRFGIAAALLAVFALALPAFASADPLGSITVFSGLRASAVIANNTAGPDGNVWFVDGTGGGGPSAVGKTEPSGTSTEYIAGTNLSGLNGGSSLTDIATGPDGKLWVTDRGTTPAIAVIDPAEPTKTVGEKEISTGLNVGSLPQGIAAGPDGNLWFTDAGTTPAIGVVNPSTEEIVKECSIVANGGNAGSAPQGIAAGPDGNLWFTDTGATRAIGKINPSTCAIEEFATGAESMPGGSSSPLGPWGIAPGPDGNVWFTESGFNTTEGRSSTGKAIGRITPSGTITYFSPGLIVGSGPGGLAAAPDGKLWFTDRTGVTEAQTIAFSGAESEQEFKVCNEAICENFKYKTVTSSATRTTLRSRVSVAYNAVYGAGTVTIGGGTTSCSGGCSLTVAFSEEGKLVATNVAQAACEQVSGTGTCSTGTTLEGRPNAIGSIVPSGGEEGTITRYTKDGLYSVSGITYSGGNAWFTAGIVSLTRIGKIGLGLYPLTVTKTGTGTGTVQCDTGSGPEACEAEYFEGTAVELTATAESGSEFTGWTGSGCSGTGTCIVTMSAAKSVEANFDLIPRTLTIVETGSGTGTVECSINAGPVEPCPSPIPNGKSVEVIATANPGSGLASLSGTESAIGCGPGSPCTFTIEANSSVTAEFEITQYALTVTKTGTGTGTVTSSPAGISCGGDCSEAYNIGTEVTLSATATEGVLGSVFTGWSGCGAVNAENQCEVTMSAVKSVEAEFSAVPKKNLTLTKTGSGIGTVESELPKFKCAKACTSAEQAFNEGTVLTLKAEAASGNTFAGWSGSGCSGTGTCVVTMSAAKSVGAEFSGPPPKKPTNPLTVTKAAGTGAGSVKGGGISCDANCSSNSVALTEGKEVTLKAKPAKGGSTFAGWTGCDSEPEGNCLVTMSGPKSVTAKFIFPKKNLTLTKTGSGIGTVESELPKFKCAKACTSIKEAFYTGTVLTLKAEAASGNTFAGWSGAGCSGTGTCVVTMSAARSVEAEFSGPAPKKPVKTLTVAKAASSTGSGTVKGGGASCDANCSSTTVILTEGKEVTLKATPAKDGSTFGGWTGCDSEPEGNCLVTMSAAKSVTAKFK